MNSRRIENAKKYMTKMGVYKAVSKVAPPKKKTSKKGPTMLG